MIYQIYSGYRAQKTPINIFPGLAIYTYF
jgi:hypothetical protein